MNQNKRETAAELIQKMASDHCVLCPEKLGPGVRFHCAKCAARVAQATYEADVAAITKANKQREDTILAPLKTVHKHYRDVRFCDDLRPRVKRVQAIDEAKTAIGRPFVMFQGVAGSGKTTLAAAMFAEVLARAMAGDKAFERLGETALWASAKDLGRARYEHALGAGEAPLIQAAEDASMLVIDDVGVEPDRDSDAISSLIYDRHANEAPTIITTGFYFEQLKAKYGDGIARRMVERQHVEIIVCGAPAVAAHASAPGSRS